MGDLVPVHEKLQRFFGDIDFDFPSTKDHKRVSVQWLHSKYLLHEGYLRKKAPHRQNKWQRRYTMLYGHHVFYFKDVKSKMPKGWFSLRPYDKVIEEFGDDPGNKKYCVKLKNSRNNEIRVFCFEAATMADLQMWKASFQATIDHIHNSGLIKDSCQEYILNIKAIPPDLTPDILRKPEYSIMMDSRVSEPELSRLARSLGRGWKSFAREKLCIPQNELDIIKEQNNSREDEVYAVLLQWRRRERDNATKRKLVGLLRDFCEEIDYCEWQFLESSSTHDYLNDMDDDEDSSDGDKFDRDVYDDIELSSQCSSNDELSNPTTQDQDFECESNEDEVLPGMHGYPQSLPRQVPPLPFHNRNQDEVLPGMQDYPQSLPRQVPPLPFHNRNQDQQTGLPLPAKPVPHGRPRLHSEPHHTTDQIPGPILPSKTVPSGRPRMHTNPHHTTFQGQEPGPSLPPRPRLPVVPTVKPHANPHHIPLERPPTLPHRSWVSESEHPPPVHFSQNDNTNQGARAPPIPSPSRLNNFPSNSNQHNNQWTTAPPIPPPSRMHNLPGNSNQHNNQWATAPPNPPPSRMHNLPGDSNQHNVQGRPTLPRRPPPAAGADPRRNPLFQRPAINSAFAAELNQVLRR